MVNGCVNGRRRRSRLGGGVRIYLLYVLFDDCDWIMRSFQSTRRSEKVSSLVYYPLYKNTQSNFVTEPLCVEIYLADEQSHCQWEGGAEASHIVSANEFPDTTNIAASFFRNNNHT